MISELGGVVAENTKMEMLATHFVSLLPEDTFTGMMVCALATGKWLLHVNFVYDSFRGRRFLKVSLPYYEGIDPRGPFCLCYTKIKINPQRFKSLLLPEKLMTFG